MSTNFDSALAMKRSLSSTSYNGICNPAPVPSSSPSFSSGDAYGNNNVNSNVNSNGNKNNHISYNNFGIAQAQPGIAAFGAQNPHISQNFVPPQSTLSSSNSNTFKRRKRARDQISDNSYGNLATVSHDNAQQSNRTMFPTPQGMQTSPFHVSPTDIQDPLHASPSSNFDMEEQMDVSPSPPSSNHPSNTPSVFSYGPSHNQYADYNSVEFVEDYMAEGYDLKQIPVMHNSLDTDTDLAQLQSNNNKKMCVTYPYSHATNVTQTDVDPANTGYHNSNMNEEMQFDPLIPSASDYRTVNSSYSASLDDITGAQYSLYDDVDS